MQIITFNAVQQSKIQELNNKRLSEDCGRILLLKSEESIRELKYYKKNEEVREKIAN